MCNLPLKALLKMTTYVLVNHKDVDFLIVGSSHAYRGFDPRVFERYGYAIFNLGSSAQSPRQTYFLLEEYLDKVSPKKVIFEVYPETFAVDGIESATDVISNDHLSMRLAAHSFGYSNILVFNTFLYRLFDEGILQREVVEPAITGKDTYIKGGFVASEEGFYKPKQIQVNAEFEFRDEQFEYFKKSVALLNDRGIPYSFIQAPVTEYLNKARPTPALFSERISNLGPYHNYQGELDLSDSLDFVDSDHLSQSGVEKFNEAVIRNEMGR